MSDKSAAYIKSLQRQICCIKGKNKPIYITYQNSSSTFPDNQNLGSWLIVTDDGTSTGVVLEMWIYNGTTWSEVPSGSGGNLPINVEQALLNANTPSITNPYATLLDIANSTSINVVENYSSLPDPTTVIGEFYWVSNSQGTKWLPGSLGGTYYNNGMYYSNGGNWEFLNVPYQATQAEVNTGTNNDKFVTPLTLKTVTDTKVDKVPGLQLSQESYTTPEKSKLAGIEAGAQVNVKPNWNASPGSVNEILNKPSIIPYKFFSYYKGTQGITGITGNSIFTLGVVTIPANTISAGDWMEITSVFTKYNTGTAQFGISIGSSIALPSVTTQFAGSQATDNNNRILAVERKQIKITANGLIAPNILATMNDSNLSNPILTITGINWGVANYIIPYVFNISATTVLANLEAFEVRIK